MDEMPEKIKLFLEEESKFHTYTKTNYLLWLGKDPLEYWK